MIQSINFACLPDSKITAILQREKLGLTIAEVKKIQTLLNRPPTLTECILWSIQGSEHCAYKSTRIHLKTLPTQASHVILGPKEDAGIVAVAKDHADHRYGIVISHESHNHPSQIVCVAAYQGVIYGGFMKTSTGIKVIEYNARFGDPEAINLLSLLTTDFVSVCKAITSTQLHTLPLAFEQQASVCQYVVPKGYPDKPHCDELNLQNVAKQDALYYASVLKEGQGHCYRMLGSRALAVLELADTVSQAKEKVAAIISGIRGNYYYRSDIGKVKNNV